MHGAEDILVVDDDADMLELTMLALSSAGYGVRGARNGAEALEEVERRMPSLILLDMLMPVMDGWQFARAFRARWDHAAPILVITAAEHAHARSAAIGADDVLPKPFDIDRLLQKTDALLSPGAGLHA